MQPECNLIATWMQPDCNLNATWMQPECNLIATWMQPDCNLNATWSTFCGFDKRVNQTMRCVRPMHKNAVHLTFERLEGKIFTTGAATHWKPGLAISYNVHLYRKILQYISSYEKRKKLLQKVSEPGAVCIEVGTNLPGVRKCTFGDLKYLTNKSTS
jgi:hypothetical protein